MTEEHLSGATTQNPLPPAASDPETPQRGRSLVLAAKVGAGVAVAVAVLTLDVLKIPADHFMQLVAVPVLTGLIVHTSAKTLN